MTAYNYSYADVLQRFPNLNWIDEKSPITRFSTIKGMKDSKWLGCKRDDQLKKLFGGSKVRKLDFLLASKNFIQAEKLSSIGAIGSGHLVSCAAAAKELSKSFQAIVFWKPLSDDTLTNLSYTASLANGINYYSGRRSLVFQNPFVFFNGENKGIIPPGASNGWGMLGMLNAAYELAQQIKDGELPMPSRIYLPFGTGGTAVGLAAGLLLAGIKTEVHAIVVVEKMMATKWRVQHLLTELNKVLQQAGIKNIGRFHLSLKLNYSFIGKAYAAVTHEALQAIEILKQQGVCLESIYTGKAAAAMLHDIGKGYDEPVLFWSTVHKPLQILPASVWENKLPLPLLRRIKNESYPNRNSRRKFIYSLVGLGVLSGSSVVIRNTGYPDSISISLKVLSAREAYILKHALHAILSSTASENSFDKVIQNIDSYLYTLPESLQNDIHLMLTSIEQLTFMDWNMKRFTNLEMTDKDAYLHKLKQMGGLLFQAYKGLRDICYLGYYQLNESWLALKYDGPVVSEKDREMSTAYQNLIAVKGSLPKFIH